MERLNEKEEELIYKIVENDNNLSAFLEELFLGVENNRKEDVILRDRIGALEKKGFFSVLWADNRAYNIFLTSKIYDYCDEYPQLKKLCNEEVLCILREVGEKYEITNIIIYDIGSCGTQQIGWEQIDEYEWRFKIEGFSSLDLNRAKREILSRFNVLGYMVYKEDSDDSKPRKKKHFSIIHKAMIENDAVNRKTIRTPLESYGVIEVREALLDICKKLQSFNAIKVSDENSINTYIRDLLKQSGIIVSDQTLMGVSAAGENPGEVDILVETPEQSAFVIIEALKLSSLDKAYIDSHLNKIFNYDANGLENNIILIYSNASNFASFCKKYKEYISQREFKYKLENVKREKIDISEIVVINSLYFRSCVKRHLTHMIINVNQYLNK